MSEENKVEGGAVPEAETDEDTERAAIWSELAKEDGGQGDPPPARADDGDGAGQGGDAPPKDEAAEKPASETADDPWKDAPPELREAHERAIEAERAERAKTEQALRSSDGRASRIQLELNSLRQTIADKRDEGGATKEGEEADDRVDRMKQLREEYPDVAGPILDEMARLETRLKQAEGQDAFRAEAEQVALIERQEAILSEKHPDWTEVRDSENFAKWLAKQRDDGLDYIIDAARRNGNAIVNGAEVADMMDRFKRDTRPDPNPEQQRQQERREEQLDASRGVDSKNPSLSARKGSDTDEAAIWNELAQKDRRMAAGR